MKKSLITSKLAKPVSKILTASLHVNANSTSCIFINQPKAPQALDRFKKFHD